MGPPPRGHFARAPTAKPLPAPPARPGEHLERSLLPDDLELIAERADVGSVSDFELEQIVQ